MFVLTGHHQGCDAEEVVFSVVRCLEHPRCEEQEPFQNKLVIISLFEENNATLKRTASDTIDGGQFSNTKTVDRKGKISMNIEGTRAYVVVTTPKVSFILAYPSAA